MGWVGTGFLLIGRFYLAKLQNNGLLFTFVGDFLWMIYGIRKKMWSVTFTGGAMALLDLIGFLKWMGVINF